MSNQATTVAGSSTSRLSADRVSVPSISALQLLRRKLSGSNSTGSSDPVRHVGAPDALVLPSQKGHSHDSLFAPLDHRPPHRRPGRHHPAHRFLPEESSV